MSQANPTGPAAVTEGATHLFAAVQQLPQQLALVAVRGKAAIGSGWQRKGHHRQRIAQLLSSGEATGVGLLSGPISGGILLVDHDGAAAGPVLQELLQGQPLPTSWQWSSGRPGRWQLALQVPEPYWQAMRNKRVIATGTTGEQLELRWTGHQSVLPPSIHPDTGEPYRWLPGRSPADLPLAEAPIALIEAMLKPAAPAPAAPPITPLPATGLARPLIEFVSQFTRQLIETGGTPGSWNDDQLKAAADLVGTEQWILQQGHRPTPTARELWQQHLTAAAAKDSSFNARRAWQRFEGTRPDATPSTDLPTLQRRLAYHQRQERRASRGSTTPRKRTTPAPAADPQPELTAPHGKRLRLEPDQILAMLPARVGTPRLNVRSGDVHLEHGAINGNDIGRLYLRLSNASEKWGKEPTADALMLLASENRFDPVADYLTSNTAAPLPIDQWSRLDQHLLGIDDPIAAEVLPRFLISAVARTMKPGAPVRQTPVLVGPQWRGKTALGRILFGAEHWVEGVDDLGRDALMKAHTAWGVELAELDGVTRRADQERLKAFLTERTDTFRAPYDRSPERHARRFVFWATSNAPPLRDPTGSTRFVVIRLPDKMLPLDWAVQHRDAIWARALERYRAGVEWDQCDEATAAAIQERNADHTQTDPWTDHVRMILNRARLEQTLPVSVPDILAGLKVPVERQTAREAARARAIAESLGWQYGRRRIDGGEKLRGFWPAEPVAGPPSGPPGPAPGHPPGHPQTPLPAREVMVPGHPGHPIQQNPLRNAEAEGQATPAGPAADARRSAAQEVLHQKAGPAGPDHQTDCAATDLPGPPRVAQRVARRVARPDSDGWPPKDQPLDCRPRPATVPGCDLVITYALAYDVVLQLHRQAGNGHQLALQAQPELSVSSSSWQPVITGGDDPSWGPRPTS